MQRSRLLLSQQALFGKIFEQLQRFTPPKLRSRNPELAIEGILVI
jgi:hypothetical protein